MARGRSSRANKERGLTPLRVEMKLFYTPGTSSLFPHIALHEAGLAFAKIKVDEHTKLLEDGADYRAVNPLGYVPALQLDDGTVLTEGVSIAQYIADQVPAKRLAPPCGSLARTKLQMWLNFIASEMQMGCFCPLFHPTTSDAEKITYHERLASRLAHLDRHLAQNQYILGEQFSLADAYLYVVLNWSRLANVDLSPSTHVLAHRKCVGARRAVRAALQAEGLRS
jgi:glutathione S-transferase